jgi:regulator of replication initiation timing
MCVEEEVVLLEEQLAAAHADVERLQTQVAEFSARQSRHEAETQELRGQLEASRAEAEAARAQAATQAEELQRLGESMAAADAQGREAVQRYREVMLEREPHLPADLVTGDSIADVDAAVERARQTVAQVKQHLDQQSQSLRVPAGAPARGSPDVSELSSAEKIRLGLSKA